MCYMAVNTLHDTDPAPNESSTLQTPNVEPDKTGAGIMLE